MVCKLYACAIAALTLPALFLLPVQAATSAPFALGADVSWLPQMEAQGVVFYDDFGVRKDCLQILKEHGINSVRLRVWVNPSIDKCTGHCGKNETVAMARRAAAAGFRIMLDFHYSDSWADPGKQTIPASWTGHTTSQLATDVYDHTADVLNKVIAAGVHPEWVQVGNETDDGMLWENGRATATGGFANLASLMNSGCNAVKAADSAIKVIIHLSNGYDNTLYRWMFDGLTSNGVKFDIIGMSSYPSQNNWTARDSQILNNCNDMVSRYGKDVMVTETGMDASAATRDMLADLIGKVASVSGGRGRGVFIWEPECFNWCNYSFGAWNTNGRPGMAMDAFLTASEVKRQTGPAMAPAVVTSSMHHVGTTRLIHYIVPVDGFVSVAVFDCRGKLVESIIDRFLHSGSYAVHWNACGYRSGAYFLRVRQSGGTADFRRLVLVK